MKNLSVAKAIAVLRDGGIVIFPTDTAFGIGCGIGFPESIVRLFSLRKRPKNKAMPLLVSSMAMAIPYLTSPLPDNVRHLMKENWPGALTVIYRANRLAVPSSVRGGGTTIGLRMPNHPITLKLIEGAGMPVLGSSANFSGGRTPFDWHDVDPALIELTDGIVIGTGTGEKASTVIDCTHMPWRIVRQGAISVPGAIIANE